jgi:hypothetical protein
MRICFYNPQAVHTVLGTTLFSVIFGRGSRAGHNEKCRFLLDLLRNKQSEVALVVDGTASSLTSSSTSLGFISNNYFLIKIISFWEIYLWCWINKINPFRQKIIFSLKELDKNNDILFGFAYFTDTFLSGKMTQRSFFKKFEGRKVLHASHFYGRTKLIADNVRMTGTKAMVAEADLKQSGYFNEYFDFIDSVIVMPFVLRERYVEKVVFSLRKSKCLALGTLVLFPEGNDDTKDHHGYFHINTLHPLRKAIYDNAATLTETVDSLIFLHNKNDFSAKKSFLERSLIYKFFSLLFKKPGKEYHSFDIVEKFNQYKMFVAPEENIGLPSINFIEGMACGCAYIGLKHPMYTELGLEDGKNYIAYDGSLDDLQRKIRYYQQNTEELEAIAKNGRIFSKQNFLKGRVIADFLYRLEKLGS